VEGRVIMYADKMTKSMKQAINETNRRRKIQVEYNKVHDITPQTIKKAIPESLSENLAKQEKELENIEELIKQKMDNEIEIIDLIHSLESQMMEFANDLKFEQAAFLRDKIQDLKINYLKKGRHG
jgi:excinuclease ABC subunit B